MSYQNHPFENVPFTLLAGGMHQCNPSWDKSSDGLDQCYKLYLPIAGQAKLKLKTQDIALRPDRAYIIPGYQLMRQECSRRMEVYWIHFTPKSLPMAMSLTHVEKVHQWDRNVLGYWQTTWEAIPRLFEKASAGTFYRIQALLLDLVTQVLEANDCGFVFGIDPAFEQLRPAIAFMDQHTMESPSLADIAKTVHLSPNYFHRRFTAKFQVTPFNYMLNRRLDLARQLLLNTDLTLRHIASRCGFYCEFHFSKIFKKHYSLSPSQFRKQAMP